MRHRRARRRFKLILVLLFTIALIFFFETRIEAFVPQLKVFIESKVEDAFEKNIKISIGSLAGGIFHPLTLNNCKVTDNSGNRLFPMLEIDRISSNYRILDAVLKWSSPRSFKAASLSWAPCADIKFATRNKKLSGFLRLEGELSHAKVKGYVNLFGDLKTDFNGKVEGRDFELDLKVGDSLFGINGALSEDGVLTANVKVNHLKLMGLDIVCDAVIKGRMDIAASDTKKIVMEGGLETKNLILNYRPFSDLKASYRISSDVLDIVSLKIGDDFKVCGKVKLKRPYDVDILILADNSNIAKIFSSLNAQDAISFISGTMNGRFELKGPIKNLKSNSRLELRKGMLGDIEFDYLKANLKGDGPIIRLEDSRISRPSGYFALAGEIDLRKLGRNNIFEDVKMVTDDTAIIWDAKDTVKKYGVQEVSMKKKMSDEVHLGFKKFIADMKVDESIRDRDEVELEYRLHPNDSLKMLIGEDKDFVGVEHRDRF